MYEVVLAVAEYYQVTVETIKGKSRKGDLPEARKMICYLLRNTVSKPYLATYLRLSRDYVYTAIKDIEFYINTYPKFKQRAMEIKEKSLTLRKAELEAFLTGKHPIEPNIMYEKQKELESINHQINKQCLQ